MKKNIDTELKRSAAKEQRVHLLALEMKRWQILRYFKLHKIYGVLAESVVRDLIAVTQNTPDRPTIYTNEGRLTLYHVRKDWTLELLKNSVLSIPTSKLKELIWELVDTGQTYEIRRELRNSFPVPPGTFYHSPENWRIQAKQIDKEDIDPDITTVKKIAVHLGTSLLAFALHDSINESIIVSESIYEQVRSFIAFGDVVYDKSLKIDLNKLDLPKPIVSIGDDLNCLVLRYSKFCNKCGGRIKACYCQDTKESFNQKELALSTSCWNCSREMIIRALMQDFNVKYPEQECKKELDDYMEGYLEQMEHYLDDNNKISESWHKTYGGWLEIEYEDADGTFSMHWRKLDRKSVERLMISVNDLYSECYDGEPGEDECSCPTWGG